ncbi:MAG: hypothetical protein ACRCZF_27260 [Gemmataceae bacterium]
MAEAIVVACPACRTPVAVPTEFLGQVVHCLKCQATFRAPTAPTEPAALLKRPRGKIPPLLLIPLYGLLLLGFAGVATNLFLAYEFRTNPEAAKNYSRGVIRQLAETKPPGEAPKEKDKAQERSEQFWAEQDAKVEEAAAQMAPYLQPMQLPFALVSAGVLAGGLAFAFRKPYWLGFLGCICAIVNVNQACCIPGAVVGLWGLFALISEEGRHYFGRTAELRTKNPV